MCIPLQAFYSIRKSFTFYQASHEIWSTSGTAAPGRQKYTASAWRCATTCAWRHPHLSLGELLHTHPPPRPPESHRPRGPMPTFPRDWLERCPGSLPGVYPHVCTRAAQAAAPHTEQSSKRGSTSTLDHRATAPLWPVPSAIAFQPSGWLILSWREGRCSPTCRQDSLQESVGLSPLGMSSDLGSHHDPSWQPLAQRQPQPSLPFLPSKRSRQFSLPKYTTWACRCKKRLQALGMNFTKKAYFWETDKFGGVLLSSAATAQYIPLLNVQCAGSS